MDSMQGPIIQAAILPFKIVESMGIKCGYERSFKLCRNTILSNRYLLGINTADVSTKTLLDACRKLDMPANFLDEFHAGLTDANLVFLGFEANATGGALYKIYLEYWDQLLGKLRADPAYTGPHMLHKGFKWQYDCPEKNLVTWYQCQPGMATDEVLQRIQSQYCDIPDQLCLDSVCQIITLARNKASGSKFVYVEVSEQGSQRKSFDLNLYPAGLQIKDVVKPISDAAIKLDVPGDMFARLMSIVAQKLLGHISAGIGRDGQEYLTIYYEN